MANARFVDAFLGYEYYVKKGGKASLDSINEFLSKEFRRQIKLRTYSHYRNLYRYGFTKYMPINKFDVFRSLGKLQLATDRRGYNRVTVDLEAKITNDGQKWVDIDILDSSVVGFKGVTKIKYSIQKKSPIWISVEGYSIIPGILVWKKHLDENSTMVGIRALQYIEKYNVMDEEELTGRLNGILTITREKEGEIKWENLFIVFEKVNLLLNALEDFVYALEDTIGVKMLVARPVLKSISFGSPGNGSWNIDTNLAEILKLLLSLLVDRKLLKRKLTSEVELVELEVKKRKIDIEKAGNENDLLEIEVARNAINLTTEFGNLLEEETIQKLRKKLPEIIGLDQPIGDFLSEENLERAILKNRIIPPLLELIAGDDGDYELGVESDEEDE